MEIKRYDLINHLIKKHGLKSYCEIGTQNRNQNFNKIICDYRYCVDPDINADADFVGTSDEFFNQNKFIYDIYFLDGLHTAEQVKKDFENALKILSPNGFIVLHDCNPEKEEHTIVPRPTKTGHWNGDVYRFAASMAKTHNSIRRMNEAKPAVYTVDVDNGCMVFRQYENEHPTDYFSTGTYLCIEWEEFDKNRKKYLNLISYDEFIAIGS